MAAATGRPIISNIIIIMTLSQNINIISNIIIIIISNIIIIINSNIIIIFVIISKLLTKTYIQGIINIIPNGRRNWQAHYQTLSSIIQNIKTNINIRYANGNWSWESETQLALYTEKRSIIGFPVMLCR